MASMWEIHDPSDLRYDTDLGLTLADSGSGPPSDQRLDSHGVRIPFWKSSFPVSVIAMRGHQPTRCVMEPLFLLQLPGRHPPETSPLGKLLKHRCSETRRGLVRAGLKRRMPPRPADRRGAALME